MDDDIQKIAEGIAIGRAVDWILARVKEHE